MVRVYVLGQDKLPSWLWNKVMIYKVDDGFKYEFYGQFHEFIASNGDKVEVEGKKWWIQKRKVDVE